MTSPQHFPSSTRASTLGSVVFWTATVGISLLLVRVHLAASLTLPVPWGDEAYFLWPARAFARTNSFIAPEYDATRPILLLPFVYHATVGMLFKLVGTSLQHARDMSFVFVLTGFWFLALLIRRHVAAGMALGIVGAIFFNGCFVAMANVGRMEALFFAAICGALVLMQRGREWLALGMLAITPMIHPNGILFLIPVALYALWARGLRHKRPEKTATLLLVAAGVIWVANGLYAIRYWDGFMHDTALRFGEMTSSNEGVMTRTSGEEWIRLALILPVAALGICRQTKVGYLLVFALGAWMTCSLRIEQWYEPFGDFSCVLVFLALIEIAATYIYSVQSLGRWVRLTAINAFAFGLLVLLRANGRIEGPVNYLDDLQVHEMRTETDVPYFSPEDGVALKKVLDALEPGQIATVEIYPWADGLLLADVVGNHIQFQVPFFDLLAQPANRWAWGYKPSTPPVPDLFLVHSSRYIPKYLNAKRDAVLERALKLAGTETKTIIHSRDGSEIWYAIRRPATTHSK